MGVLVLDEKNLHLNVQVGVLENYKPTKDHKELQKKLDKIREKKKNLDEQYSKVFNDEIIPALVKVRTGVRDINEKRYPELKKKREADEAAKQPNVKSAKPRKK